jgi:hypothetical protein
VHNTTVVLFNVFGVNQKPNILKFPSIKSLNHLNANLGGIYKVYDVLSIDNRKKITTTTGKDLKGYN